MERVGIAASKIAKGNLFLYNFFVIVLIFLFTFLLFLLSGSFVVITLIVISYLVNAGSIPDLKGGWMPIMVACLKVIFCLVTVLALWALAINIKLRKK